MEKLLRRPRRGRAQQAGEQGGELRREGRLAMPLRSCRGVEELVQHRKMLLSGGAVCQPACAAPGGALARLAADSGVGSRRAVLPGLLLIPDEVAPAVRQHLGDERVRVQGQQEELALGAQPHVPPLVIIPAPRQWQPRQQL